MSLSVWPLHYRSLRREWGSSWINHHSSPWAILWCIKLQSYFTRSIVTRSLSPSLFLLFSISPHLSPYLCLYLSSGIYTSLSLISYLFPSLSLSLFSISPLFLSPVHKFASLWGRAPPCWKGTHSDTLCLQKAHARVYKTRSMLGSLIWHIVFSYGHESASFKLYTQTIVRFTGYCSQHWMICEPPDGHEDVEYCCEILFTLQNRNQWPVLTLLEFTSLMLLFSRLQIEDFVDVT